MAEAAIEEGLAKATATDVGEQSVKEAAAEVDKSLASDAVSELSKSGELTADLLEQGFKDAGVQAGEEGVAKASADASEIVARKASVETNLEKGVADSLASATDADKPALQTTADGIAKEGTQKLGTDGNKLISSNKSDLVNALKNNPKLLVLGLGVAGLALYCVITNTSPADAAASLGGTIGKVAGSTIQAAGEAILKGAGGLFSKLFLGLGIAGGIALIIFIIIFIVRRMRKNKVMGVSVAPPPPLAPAYYYY